MGSQIPLHRSGGDASPESGGSSGGLFFWGIIALLGGGLLIASQFMDLDVIMPWALLAVGLAMLLWGMFARSPGGLIPGAIVTGVATGLTLVGPERMDASEAGTGYFLLCLAIGFLVIPFLTRIFVASWHWWAFIPGAIIFLVGLALIFGGPFFQALTLLQLGGALALFGLGVWLIYSYTKRVQ
jgi:hypothetical protein